MRVLIIAFSCAFVAGCETAPVAEFSPTDYLRSGSNAQVCEVVIYALPEYANLGAEEAARRGIQCRDYQEAAAALYQQRQAAASAPQPTMGGAILHGIGEGLRRPRSRIPGVTCSSIGQGGVLTTTCN